MKSKALSKIAPLGVLALFVAACGSATPTAAPTTKPAAATAAPAAATSKPAAPAASSGPAGTIRSVLPTGCMQGPLWTTCGRRIDEVVLPGLVMAKWTGDGVQPMLAESWETKDGGQTWTFKLRKDVKWHDGKPFTADDVVYSLNLYANPTVASIFASKLADVKGYKEFRTDKTAQSLSGVTKVDDHTVKVELVGPRPLWVDLLLINIAVMPEHILGKVPLDKLQSDPYWTQNRIGTGAFKWNKYVPDQSIELLANPDYFLGKPKADRFIFQMYADIPARLNALAAGEVDIMSWEGGGVPLNEIARMKAVPYLTVLENLNAGLPTYLQFNFKKDFLADPKVRQAMVYAIDRDKIMSSIRKAGTVANTMFPATWTHPSDMNPYKYDPAKAKQLLAEAKWDPNRKVDFIYYYSDSVNVDTVTAIQAYLAAVGVQIVPRLLAPAAINQVYADGTFEMGLFANGQGLDPSLGALTSTCGATIALGYCNKTVDELYAKGLTEQERAKRAPSYQQISKIFNDEMFRGWLYYDVRPLAFNNRIPAVAEHFKQMPTLIFDNPVYMEQEKWQVQ